MNLAGRWLDLQHGIGRGLASLLAWAVLCGTAAAGSVEPLRLGADTPVVEAWPALRVLADPEQRLDAAAALAAKARFETPEVPRGNLGPRRVVTWLHLPLAIEPDAPPTWALRLQYSMLHEVQVHVFNSTGHLVHQARLGALIPFAEREQQTRALSTLLDLPRGQRFDVLLRVDTPTAMLVPIAFLQPSALGIEESREQALQGLMSGLWLFMILYSLVNWLHRRETLFLAYATALVSSWLFSQAVYGTGPQYLWPHSSWLTANLSALAPLFMVLANVHFFVGALDMRLHEPRAARLMGSFSVVAGIVAGLFMLDMVSYRTAAVCSMGLVVVHLGVVIPVTLRRIRGGDRAAIYLLAGVAIYIAGVGLLIGLMRGLVSVGFLSMHGAQFSFAAEMVCWLMVLGARLEHVRLAADAARHEHKMLHLLAHSDALTGLHNRRGLLQALEAGSSDGRPPVPGQRLAVFMLDLDGFKPVNDRWGHDTGDELLRQVAQRLTHAVRPSDVVARLGGDEFVVAVFGLSDEAQAELIGRKLLAQFGAAFVLGDDRRVSLGATIGFASGALPQVDPIDLLQRADAAMYDGKQSGKNTLVAAPA